MLDLNDVARAIHQTAREKGFWDHEIIEDGTPIGVPNPSIYEEKLMLVVSEVAEMLEARRDCNSVEEEVECADVFIRLLDYCAARGFDIEKAILAKMGKNRSRPHLHGRER